MSIAEKLLTIANNTPAVCEAVNASKSTATGRLFRVDDVLDVAHPLQIKTEPGATVAVYGKNILDYTRATGRTTAQTVEIVDDGVVWKAGGNYYFTIPIKLSAGVKVCGSFVYEPNSAGERIEHMRLVYEDNTTANLVSGGGNTSYTVNTTKAVKAIYFYKYTPSTALTQDLLISNIQLEIGTETTAYEAYKSPQIATSGDNGVVSGLTPVYPTMTIAATATVECTYFPTSDTYNKYQELTRMMTELNESITIQEE